MKGKVVCVNAGYFEIVSNEKKYITRGSGNLRNTKQSPIVGDEVEFQENGFLTKILPRKNFLTRPKVANIDQVIVIMSLKEPNYSSLLLNKFLAIIEFNKIHPVIIFTKCDLTNVSYKNEYQRQGYETYECSNKNIETDDWKIVKGIFQDKISVFTGQTGAGKTSTINTLTKLNLKTQAISKSLNRGKHTTRMTIMIDWMGGKLIDTPGFSSLEFNLNKKQLSISYHDFATYAHDCYFSKNCSHNSEPKCKVKSMVKKGMITHQRYNDYLKLLNGIGEK